MSEKDSRAVILGILDQVANEVSSELDLQTVLQNTAGLIKKVIDYSFLAIGLLDENGKFKWVLQEGYGQEVLDSIDISVDEGIVGEAVRRKEVIAVGEVSRHPGYIPVPIENGVVPRSELAVPLVSKDKAIGVIALECTEPSAFSEEHRLMMRSVATHLAAAVANARLHEQTLEQIKMMEVIERIGREISSVLDLEELLREIARLTRLVIEYQAFGVFLVDRARGEFINRLAIGYDREALRARHVKLDEGLRGKVLRQGRPVLVNDVLSDPAHIRYDLEIDDVIRSQMVVPLQTKNKIVGVLVLGNVRKDFFDERHLRIATGLATQIAIALENARVFGEVSLSEEKLRGALDIAREIQRSMLPDSCPEIEGFDIDGESRPAVVVGGDFYDFIKLPEDRMGVVVGDVSGYGLPGALVMTSAREVLRIYAEFDPDPAELMNRADRRLKADLSAHMFVALLYGIVDPLRRTFTFSNAGLLEPALVRGGKASFLSSPGKRLPLGKLLDRSYESRTVTMHKDDILVLATDGAVEIWNSKERQFGFRRFLRTLSQPRPGVPPSEITGRMLINTVFDRLEKFAGSADLQDDVTLVTVKAL